MAVLRTSLSLLLVLALHLLSPPVDGCVPQADQSGGRRKRESASGEKKVEI